MRTLIALTALVLFLGCPEERAPKPEPKPPVIEMEIVSPVLKADASADANKPVLSKKRPAASKTKLHN